VHARSLLNQSIKILAKSHTQAQRSHLPAPPHAGSKSCVAKRRRLGGLRASRASVSLSDSIFAAVKVTPFYRSARKLPRKMTHDLADLVVALVRSSSAVARSVVRLVLAFTQYSHHEYRVACIAIQDGRRETLYCVIMWAMQRGVGVPKQRGCLRMMVLIPSTKASNETNILQRPSPVVMRAGR